MNHLPVVFFFLFLVQSVFSVSITSAESPEIPAETKKLYEDALVKVFMLRNFVDNLVVGRGAFREPKTKLFRAIESLEKSLMSDKMIEMMSGYQGHVEGENSGFRMLRIYRNDTRFPFAQKMTATRMKRSRNDNFPKGFSGFEEIWTEFMDRDQIHFSFETPSHPLGDLRSFIEQKAVAAVTKRLNEIYVAQGGVLNIHGKIDFNNWDVESHVFIYDISRGNYRSVYQNLHTIKFIRK